MSDRRTILILSANPKGTNPLRLGEEIREIKEGLRRSKYRDLYQIETAEAVRVGDIQRAMLDYEPKIVHFCGHGGGQEGLVFEDVTGQIKLVSAEALAGLFSLFADRLDCVLLNACYSEVQAREISRHINSVIGMSQAIGDRAAIAFAVGFYDALGADRDVDFAYRLGCNAISMQGIPEHLTPKLLTKNNATKPEKTMTSQRVFISYRSQEPDVSLAQEFHDRLQAAGHTAFMAAKSISWGENWIERIDQELKQCDYFLLLLSEQSASSDMVAGEVRTARGLRDKVGKPIILPIRVNLPIDDPLNYELRSVLQTIQQKSWRSPDDTPILVQEILSLMAAGEAPEPVTVEIPVVATIAAKDLPPVGKGNSIQSNQDFEFDAYISYVDRDPDSTWVKNVLLPKLKEAGLHIAVSGDSGLPGVPFIINFEQGMKQSKRTIVVLSENYLLDNMTTFESALGQSMGILEGSYRVLPVKMMSLDHMQLPVRWSMLTILELSDPRRAEREFQRLVQSLESPLPKMR